jgi:hypothetical protein
MNTLMHLAVLLLLTIPVIAEEKAEVFDYLVAATRQDASMDWWYAVPAQFGPKLALVSSVSKGEYFNIIPFFKNYGVASNGQANITYDIEIIRPDGSIDEAMKDCAGHDGKATSPNLIPARAVLRLCFDPDDPYGEYTINVTAYDHVSSQTNAQSQTIKLAEFKIDPTTKEEREKLFYHYATAPNPSRALASFLQTEHSFLNAENEPIWSAIWFFKTLFENNEFLIPHLLGAFPEATLKQQKDMILLLALMDRTQELPKLSDGLKAYEKAMSAGRVPDPYAEITTGKQLDMLWAEYFATGRIKPIRQLVTALNLCEHIGTLEKIKTGELDPKVPEVYRKGMLEAVFQSALWSLRSNCVQSPLIYHYGRGILDTEELEEPAQSYLGFLLQSIAKDLQKPDAPTMLKETREKT